MIRSAILAASVGLFCVPLCSTVQAQRIAPRRSILKKPVDSAATKDSTASAKSAAGLAPGTGSIMGAALDSLHEEMLVHAGVSIMGLPHRHSVTTEAGAFRIDSIPPGKYVLEVTHPVLDSLGIRLLSDSISVADGQVRTIELAVPGSRTLIASVCTAAKLRFGPGVILGRVVDADTDKPAVGAEVSVAWNETEVNTVVGVRTTPHVRKATVAADGTYRICGVPANFSGSLQAMRGTAKTAEVPIEVADQALSMRMLLLPPVTVAAGDTGTNVTARRVGRAVITGKVTNAGGVPVPGARVSVQGSESSTSTGPDGRFTLTGVLPGTQSVLVRRVGYSPVEQPIDVTALATNQMTVRLGAFTPVLSSVDVKAKSDPMEATGFDRRRKMGMGRYIDLDDIKKMSPTYTSDIIRRIPGIYVNGSGSSANVTTTRGNGCVAFLIDNNAVSADAGQSIDQIIGEQDVAAMEFYSPVNVPMELTSGSNNGCALLVIWTKGKLAAQTKAKP